MEKKRKMILISSVVLALMAGTAFYAYPKIKNRYFPTKNFENANGSSSTDDSGSSAGQVSGENADASGGQGSGLNSLLTNPEGLNISDDSADGETVPLDPDRTDGGSGGNMLAHITTEHCNTNCKAFANNLELFEYCEQVCGITPEKNVSNCDGKKDIEKDYCLKDLGIAKSDSSICDKIDDVNVRNTCRDRITEDIIEKQSSPSEDY